MARLLSIAVTTVASAILTVLAYLLWLGWHAEQHRVPGTQLLEGPYETWQVIGLVITLVAIVAVASWMDHGWAAVVTVTLVVTLVWARDAATEPREDASFWPIGMVLVLVGAAMGLSVVAIVVQLVRSTAIRHSTSS